MSEQGYERDYQPRSGDGSIAAEDDALLRQPHDEAAGEPDVEHLRGYNPNAERLEADEPGGADTERLRGRTDHPEDPEEGVNGGASSHSMA